MGCDNAPKVALTIGNLSKKGAYVDALVRTGIEPVLNPDSLDSFDGLLLAGGADVNPALYGEQPAPETEAPDTIRDRRESALLAEALERDVPVLGICRGNQFFNVYFGGKLVQHLPNCEVHRRQDTALAHEVRPVPGTLLASITGTDTLTVNSRHHQGVAAAAPGLTVAAVCPSDNLVEALEIPGKRFALAVQWHPEDRPDVECDRRIFEAFAQALRCPPPPKP
jgi:putative glutamine amidotransferase